MALEIMMEFEKRHTGDVSDTMRICTEIAKDNGLNPETVADFVYINRYENDVPDFDMLEEE